MPRLNNTLRCDFVEVVSRFENLGTSNLPFRRLRGELPVVVGTLKLFAVLAVDQLLGDRGSRPPSRSLLRRKKMARRYPRLSNSWLLAPSQRDHMHRDLELGELAWHFNGQGP